MEWLSLIYSPTRNLLIINNILNYWSTPRRSSKDAKSLWQNINSVKLNKVTIISIQLLLWL